MHGLLNVKFYLVIDSWILFKICLLLIRTLLERYFFLVLLVVFWDFCCNFLMILIYKCNYVESWKFESSAIWRCVVISVYFKGLRCPHLWAEVGRDLFFFLSKASPLCLNMLLMKLIKNKSRHNCTNNLSSVTCFGSVSQIHNCGMNLKHCNM
jgi:hypothetical protein